VEADVYVWRFALLVVHARKEEEEEAKRLAWGNVSEMACFVSSGT